MDECHVLAVPRWWGVGTTMFLLRLWRWQRGCFVFTIVILLLKLGVIGHGVRGGADITSVVPWSYNV